MEQTDPRTGRTPARLAFADHHMNRFMAGFVPFCVIPDSCFASYLDLAGFDSSERDSRSP
jgi:hypothetical protein